MNKSYLLKSLIVGAIILFFLVVIRTFNIAYPVEITTSSKPADLAVVGEGKVDVVPDSASVNVGISVTNATTVGDAQTQINKVNNAIVTSMQKLGVDKKDIKTSNYSVYPNYDYQGNRTITGYGADVQVSITTKNTQQVSQIVQAATAAGANTISGTSFSVSDPAKYREEARNKAIANAKEQAQKIADSLGIKLGKVTNIVESSSNNPPVYPMLEKATMGAGGGPAPDLQEGTQTISSVVTLYFEKR